MSGERLDRMISQKVEEAKPFSFSSLSNSPNVSLNNSFSFKNRVLAEEITDFSDFADYRRVCIPIKCGEKAGVVCAFAHKSHLDSRFDRFYISGLRNLIERKKYTESEKWNFDVGPAYAIASAIEDGDYFEFLKNFQEDEIKLRDFEHIFRVEENGNVYHLLPKCYEIAFGNIEQIGLFKFSIIKAFGDIESLKDKSKVNVALAEWLSSNKNENAVRLREILNSSKQDCFEGIPRTFSNCLIYKNLLNRLITSFQLDSLISKLKELNEK